MKLSINKYEGYANMPEFTIDYCGIKFDPPVVMHMADTTDAWFMAFNYDLSVLNYRLLCKERSHGNTNFGYKEGGYESGWSSRASVINKQLGYSYIDVSQRAIELDKLLYLIQEQYNGLVLITERETDTDMEYCVVPYFVDKHKSYYSNPEPLVMHSNELAFVEIALHHLTGHEDMYVWPDGDVHYDSMPSWKSDDCVYYPAK